MATQTNNKKGVLLIGLVCEDIICTVPTYPKEDDKVRCSSSVLKRGGNAANSAVVLSLLNSLNAHTTATDLYFMASLSSKERSKFVISDLNRYGIDTELCVYHKDHGMTVSYILVSTETKSRTIINHPCLKPFSFQDFMHTISGRSTHPNAECNVLQTIDHTLKFVTEYNLFGATSCVLDKIQMIHVETRWIASMLQVLGYIKKHHPNIFISIEIEKERLYNDDDGRSLTTHDANKPVNDLIPFADLVFFSRQIVKQRGYAQNEDNPHRFIKDMIREYGGNRAHPLSIVVPWGETGAFGIKYDCSLALYDEDHHRDVEIQFSKAYSPKQVMDTIGAGDTYIGAYLHYAIAHGVWKYNVNSALNFACQVAGFKVGRNGFDCIRQFKCQNI